MGVLEQTRELGLALIKTKEYVNMRAAELDVARNEEARTLMAEFDVLRERMSAMMTMDGTTPADIVRHGEEMRALQMRMQSSDLLRRMNETRGAFSHLLERVNEILKYIVTNDAGGGQEEDADGDGQCACEECADCRLH